jgi:predicted site-specific integrase-resolvase
MEPPNTPRTKTADHVAARFGVSLATLYRWRRQGLIQGTRVGHYLVFADTEIERFAAERFAGLDVAS